MIATSLTTANRSNTCTRSCSGNCECCPHNTDEFQTNLFGVYYEIASSEYALPDIELIFKYHDYNWDGHRYAAEMALKIILKRIFNVSPVRFNRKSPFSKSGFVGKAGKRRKN